MIFTRKSETTPGNSLPITARATRLFIPLLIIPLFTTYLGALDNLKFEHISIEQGLSQSHITAIFQDRQGFMWFGTADGLNKHDGYRFYVYRYDPSDSTSISGNYIYHIFEDRQRFLWIKTSGGGINKFNPVTEKFTHYSHDPENPGSLSNDDVTLVFEDRSDNLWIGTNGGGLNLFDREADQFIHFKRNPAEPNSLSNNFISTILEDRQGNLWIATKGGGLCRMDPPGPGLAARMQASLKSAGNMPALNFTTYFAQGPTYLPRIFHSIDSLVSRNRLLSGLLHIGNYQEASEFFTLKHPSEVLVVSMGDGDAYGMRDYGWIENEKTAETIWEMKYEKSKHGGGGARNRIQIAVVSLPAGEYRLRYYSDKEHAFDAWITEMPENPQFWGIQIFSLTRKEAKYFKSELNKQITPNSLSHNWIISLYEDSDGNLWIGTADGLSRFNRHLSAEQQFTVFKHNPEDPHTLNHSYIFDIYSAGKKSDKYLWIRTAGKGLNLLARDSGKVTRHFGSFPSSRRLIDDFMVTAIHRDSRGIFWVGTEDAGLFRFNQPSISSAFTHGRFSQAAPGSDERNVLPEDDHLHEPGNPQSLSHDAITCIFEDQSGIIWIGTRQGGLNKFNRKKQYFKHYTHIPGEPQSLSHKVVTAILQDHTGNLWIGTAGGGLNKLEPDSLSGGVYRYYHFQHDTSEANCLSHNHVSAIIEDRSGDIWVGTYGGGLNLYNRATQQFKHYVYNPYLSHTISGNLINTIYEDRYGQLWIGTNSGLNKLDKASGRFTKFRQDPGDPYSLGHNEVLAIVGDRQSKENALWIGTRGAGLYHMITYDRDNVRFIRCNRELPHQSALNNPAILSIYENKSDTLWFGTYSGGLNGFDRKTETFTFFTERDGLANNMISGILEDRQANLWLSTNKGISKFNPRTGDFKNYDLHDGLQANEFSPGAFYQNEEGMLFFGGINGFTAFYPESITDNLYIPPIALTSFSILGKPTNERLLEAVYTSKSLYLAHNENFFSIEFSALDYTNPLKNQYAYKLEGLEQGWVSLGSRRYATYTNLDPGRYVFHVRGSNNDLVWNEAGTSVSIVINPPFWKTWWFYLLGGTILVFLAVAAHKYRLRSRIKRLWEIEQVRMQENERVRSKAAHDFHDELGHKLTKISLFSEILKRHLHDSSPETSEYLNRINETAKSLSSGMKDFIWNLDPGKDTLHEVVIRLKDFGDELFDKTGIAFRVQGISRELEMIRLSTDWRRHLTLIFKEAMNNALKHAQCQNVALSIMLLGNQLEIILSDDGKGLYQVLPTRHQHENTLPGNYRSDVPENNIVEEIPGVDHEFVHRQPSPGNGLVNMKLRAEKLNSRLTYNSESRGGTKIKFSAEIPRSGN